MPRKKAINFAPFTKDYGRYAPVRYVCEISPDVRDAKDNPVIPPEEPWVRITGWDRKEDIKRLVTHLTDRGERYVIVRSQSWYSAWRPESEVAEFVKEWGDDTD